MKIRSPLITLGAVAAAAAAIWLVNGSHESGTAPPAVVPVTAPASAPTTQQAPPTVRQAPPTTVPAPATRYHSEIPTGNADLVVDIEIDGDRARAYACDNQGVEVWLRGRTTDGRLTLADVDGTGRLDGQVTATGLAGTLSVNGMRWAFHAYRARSTDA